MKKCVLSFILGGIIFGSIVYAYQYSAQDITYTPSDNKWNVHNVKNAIEDLKQTSDTTIVDLNNQVSTLQSSNENKDQTITNLNREVTTLSEKVNKYKDMQITLSGFSSMTGNSAAAFNLDKYKDKYKYFKITNYQKASGVSSCDMYAWSLQQNKNITMTLNTEYEILSSTDNYNFTNISIIVNSKSNSGWNDCTITVSMYNK